MRFIRLQSVVLALGLLMVAGVVANFSAPVAHAQAISGDITGTVSDISKAVIVKATVVAKNVGTGIVYTATTGGAGDYRLPNLPPGTYDLTASAPGFAKSTLKNFAVELNKVSTANFTLKVSANETVEVSAEAGVALDTTTAQLETSFSAQQLTELPAATNNVLNLSLMTAGVASSGGIGQGTGPAVGGQRPTDNNYMVEGIDNNDKSVPGPLLYVPSDAVSQFTAIQNQYSAEFGHSNGGQFNQIIKSGTNHFHGLAYEYSQNRNYNAIDAGTARTFTTSNPFNPRYDDNRFGGQVGGPIFKNKLFFFTNYEQEPIGAPGSTASFCAPTAAGFTTLSGLSGVSATNLSVYKQYSPVAATQSPGGTDRCPATVTVGGAHTSITPTAIPVGDVGFIAGSYQNNYRTINSVDYTPNSKDSIRVRYLYNKSQGPDTAATFPSFWLMSPSLFHLATVSEFHTFTPNLTSEFRFGYNRFYNETPAGGTFPGMTVFPNLTFNDMSVDIGPDPNAPQGTIQNTYQGSETVIYIKGRHTMKGGFEFRDVISPQLFVQRARGDYVYTKLSYYLADVSPDYLNERNATAPGASPTYYGNEKVMYAYFQDDWKVNQKLALNMGVRYEYTGVPVGEQQQVANAAASVPGLITFGVPAAQKANFVPRFGFAYSLDSKTVVRGGFGMGYDVLYDNLGILSSAPQYQITEDGVLSAYTPGFLAGGGLPAHATFSTIAQQRAATTAYVPDQKLPYAINWSLGIERTFAQNYTIEARYLGTHGVSLPTQNRLNVQSGTTATNQLYESFDSSLGSNGNDDVAGNLSATAYTYTSLYANAVSKVPAYTAAGFTRNIVAFEPWTSSMYHGLATQLTRRFAHGLLFNAAFTWSKTMDDATATAFSTYITPRRPQDPRNLKADWSRSALDRKLRFTYAMVWDLPYFKTSSNVYEKNILGGWEIAPVFTYQSPEFGTVQSGYDPNLNNDTAGDRAFYNPLGRKGTGSDINEIWDPNVPAGAGCQPVPVGNTNCVGDIVGWAAVNGNAQYIEAGPGTFPNDLRNSLALPGIRDLDATAMKRINLYKQTKLEFSAQVWNVLNKSQYTPGSINSINSVGYTGTTVLEMLSPWSPTFDQPNQVFNNNARAMQLSLKFIF